ncbi:MAG: class I SAM-dependent methyltransferase [Parvularculaceae bacterium]
MNWLLAYHLDQAITTGRIAVVDFDGRRREFGEATTQPLTVRLHDRRAEFDLALRPELALGELYMDGRLTVEDGSIADLLQLIACNTSAWRHRGLSFSRPHGLAGLKRARRNVAHHYDLSGALFGLFLDTDRQYSCAFFETEKDTLETAQLNKKRRIAAKLALEPGQTVLDIGSGWGGLALYLAKTAQAEITGVTLSAEQFHASEQRALQEGLSGRVRFRLEDYRRVDGTYDRVVSVGMLEHVGRSGYQDFFEKTASLLADKEVALIHFIGGDRPTAPNPWFDKYIFPGGYTPALSEVLPAIEDSGLIVTDIEVLRLHYAFTLAEWRRRFIENLSRAAAIYDERFCRMWEFYPAACEMAFRHQRLVVFQIQLAKRIDALQIARDYMIAASSTIERSDRHAA